METMHYHVGHNMPGYLPESDPYLAETKTEAIELLRADRRFAEDTYPDARFYGNAEDLFYETNFGYVYWADVCFEDCEREE